MACLLIMSAMKRAPVSLHRRLSGSRLRVRGWRLGGLFWAGRGQLVGVASRRCGHEGLADAPRSFEPATQNNYKPHLYVK